MSEASVSDPDIVTSSGSVNLGESAPARGVCYPSEGKTSFRQSGRGA